MRFVHFHCRCPGNQKVQHCLLQRHLSSIQWWSLHCHPNASSPAAKHSSSIKYSDGKSADHCKQWRPQHQSAHTLESEVILSCVGTWPRTYACRQLRVPPALSRVNRTLHGMGHGHQQGHKVHSNTGANLKLARIHVRIFRCVRPADLASGIVTVCSRKSGSQLRQQ